MNGAGGFVETLRNILIAGFIITKYFQSPSSAISWNLFTVIMYVCKLVTLNTSAITISVTME